MKFKLLLIAGIAVFGFQSRADAISEQLRSKRVRFAAETCNFLTGGCATKWEVKAGHSNHISGSCHYVDKAMDIYGSNECLNAFALCLVPHVATLYCYKNWWIGGMVNWVNEGKCVPGDHQTHIHLQPIGGCAGQVPEGRSRRRR